MANDEISARERLAEAIAEEDLLPEDLQELRLALVMTGGVSLAVWMGGTALEFSRLIRADRNADTTYLELLRLTRSLPRVDVIAGTSAGGLNGALLAYAVTQDAEVSGLRDLWLEARVRSSSCCASPPSRIRRRSCEATSTSSRSSRTPSTPSIAAISRRRMKSRWTSSSRRRC